MNPEDGSKKLLQPVVGVVELLSAAQAGVVVVVGSA